LRAIRLFASKIADSVAEGAQAATDKETLEISAAAAQGEAAPAAAAEGAVEGGDNVSMEEVLGAGARKRPGKEDTEDTEEVPQVESQPF